MINQLTGFLVWVLHVPLLLCNFDVNLHTGTAIKYPQNIIILKQNDASKICLHTAN